MLIVFLLGAVSNQSLGGLLDWLGLAAIVYLVGYVFFRWNRNHPGLITATIKARIEPAIKWISEKIHLHHKATTPVEPLTLDKI